MVSFANQTAITAEIDPVTGTLSIIATTNGVSSPIQRFDLDGRIYRNFGVSPEHGFQLNEHGHVVTWE